MLLKPDFCFHFKLIFILHFATPLVFTEVMSLYLVNSCTPMCCCVKN